VCPGHEFIDTLAGRMAGDPEFKVLRAVIASYSIAVMDGLLRAELAAEHLCHHIPVLIDIAALVAMLKMVAPEHHIAILKGSVNAISAQGCLDFSALA
jgi:hypothetical protein